MAESISTTELYRWVRAIGGLAAILTFLGLLAADVIIHEVTLGKDQMEYLFLLIAALLGLDIILEKVLGVATDANRDHMHGTNRRDQDRDRSGWSDPSRQQPGRNDRQERDNATGSETDGDRDPNDPNSLGFSFDDDQENDP